MRLGLARQCASRQELEADVVSTGCRSGVGESDDAQLGLTMGRLRSSAGGRSTVSDGPIHAFAFCLSGIVYPQAFRDRHFLLRPQADVRLDGPRS